MGRGAFSVVFLFIFLSVAIDLNAQATLFHNSGLTKANLTTADATKYEYFEYSPDVDGLWLMHLSNFSSQVAGGYLRIKVPGNDNLRRYKARYVQAKPNRQNYLVWRSGGRLWARDKWLCYPDLRWWKSNRQFCTQ